MAAASPPDRSDRSCRSRQPPARPRSSMYSGARPNLHAASTATPIWSVSSAWVTRQRVRAQRAQRLQQLCGRGRAQRGRQRDHHPLGLQLAEQRRELADAGAVGRRDTPACRAPTARRARALRSARSARGVRAGVGFMMYGLRTSLQLARSGVARDRREARRQRAAACGRRPAAPRSTSSCRRRRRRRPRSRRPSSAAAAPPGSVARASCAPPAPGRRAARAASACAVAPSISSRASSSLMP